jgi:hypothetical protein
MYSIGEQLYPDNILSEQRMFGDTSMLYGYPQKNEIFYSLKDGNWGDITTWGTVSGRVGLLPSTNDTVYVRHNVIYNINSLGYSIKKLFISGRLSMIGTNGNQIQVESIYCSGIFDFSAGASSTSFLAISRNDSYINTFIRPTSGSANITYNGFVDQDILPIDYYNITLINSTKRLTTTNTIIYGALTISGAKLDLVHSDLTVLGNTSIGVSPNLSIGGFRGDNLIKSGNGGNILFVGSLSTPNNGGLNIINFSNSNPNIEFRGGIIAGSSASVPYGTFNLGTGNISFTTNNQTISNGTISLEGNNSIDNNIEITVSSGAILNLYSSINGGNSNSKLINRGTTYFYTSIASTPMTTGIFDYYTFANTIGYVYNGNDTIKQTALSSLYITGTGTKTLIGDTTLSGSLLMNTIGVIGSPTILELSSYNLSISGVTTLFGYNQLSKSSSGNVIFSGVLTLTANSAINFSGNPTIEFRGGMSTNNSPSIFNLGNNKISFTTNNQTFLTQNNGGWWDFYNDMDIVGAISITFRKGSLGDSAVYKIYGLINGTHASSELKVETNLLLMTSTSASFMSVGILNTSSSFSGIGYMWDGNYTIPITSFYNLFIGGTGTKTLSGNTTINRDLTFGRTSVSTGGILECSSYNLTILGVTSITSNGAGFLKSGGGNIEFTGIVSVIGYPVSIDFSIGNPTIEFKGGISANNFFGGVFNLGSGVVTFSTNNQSIITQYSSTTVLNFYDIIISGSISLTLQTVNNYNSRVNIINSINGTVAGSSLILGTGNVASYLGSSAPMITGSLNSSTNLNTWYYGNDNQDIKGGTYRNLILNGGGVKTLQGNVSVLNTYTLTAPATKNDNGYTFGNP